MTRADLAAEVLVAPPELDADVPGNIAAHGPDDPLEWAAVELAAIVATEPVSIPAHLDARAQKLVQVALHVLHGAVAYRSLAQKARS